VTQRIEEQRHEHCTYREPSHSVAIGLLRALAATVIVVAAYYLLPLNNLAGLSLGVALGFGLLALSAVVAYQVRAIIRHPHSAVRAIEALAITVPVFLLLFAATYFSRLNGSRRHAAAHPSRPGPFASGRLRASAQHAVWADLEKE
jgi:hypothetical protein